MLERLYHILIEPRQRDADLRNREVVLNLLLASTLTLLGLALLLMVVLLVIFRDGDFSTSAGGLAIATLSIGMLYRLSRSRHYHWASSLLIALYFMLATVVVYRWGIATPTGILLYGLVIVLAGILLGPRFSVYFAIGITLLLACLQYAAVQGVIHPDWSWLSAPPNMADVVSYGLIFSVIAVVSWLFNDQMERSLHRAQKAEAALTRQKSLLETTVEERTRELQTAQLEKIQQMYRFAELGQLSTALLHDLSNHLTSLTLDIEGLQGQGRSRVLDRARRSIHYIDDMVVRVRDQLHGKARSRAFNVIDEVDAVVKMLRHKAQATDVLLKWKPPADKKAFKVRGEPIRLRQLMANLISNGIDAYGELATAEERREVSVVIELDKRNCSIVVSDWGRGIPKDSREKLFEPFFSTKQTGMGMGLYIAKQVAEEHFLGSIELASPEKSTTFVVTIPRADA